MTSPFTEPCTFPVTLPLTSPFAEPCTFPETFPPTPPFTEPEGVPLAVPGLLLGVPTEFTGFKFPLTLPLGEPLTEPFMFPPFTALPGLIEDGLPPAEPGLFVPTLPLTEFGFMFPLPDGLDEGVPDASPFTGEPLTCPLAEPLTLL